MTRPTGHSRCTMCIAHFRILQILAKKTQTTLQHNDGRMKRAPDSCASISDSRPKLLSASLNHFTPLFMLYYLYVCTCMKSPPIWPTLHANSDTLFCLPHSVRRSVRHSVRRPLGKFAGDTVNFMVAYQATMQAMAQECLDSRQTDPSNSRHF